MTENNIITESEILGTPNVSDEIKIKELKEQLNEIKELNDDTLNLLEPADLIKTYSLNTFEDYFGYGFSVSGETEKITNIDGETVEIHKDIVYKDGELFQISNEKKKKFMVYAINKQITDIKEKYQNILSDFISDKIKEVMNKISATKIDDIQEFTYNVKYNEAKKVLENKSKGKLLETEAKAKGISVLELAKKIIKRREEFDSKVNEIALLVDVFRQKMSSLIRVGKLDEFNFILKKAGEVNVMNPKLKDEVLKLF